MARIPYPDLASAGAEFRRAVGAKPLNIMRMMGNAEAPALALLQLGGSLLADTELDPKLRELVILRISALSEASYETHQHRRHARNAGVTADKIDAVGGHIDETLFSSVECRVLALVDDVFMNVKADRARFDSVAALLSPRALVELFTTIGFYMLICLVLVNFEIEIEDSE